MVRKKLSEKRKRQRTRKHEREVHLSLDILISFKAINLYIDKLNKNEAKKKKACAEVRTTRRKLITLSGSQNHRCCYCGGDTWHPEIIDYKSKRSILTRATIEHILLNSQGGTLQWNNIVMACSECNTARGNMPIEAFMDSIHAVPPKPQNNKTKRKNCEMSRERRLKTEKKMRNLFRLLIIASYILPEDYQYVMENVNIRMTKVVFGGNNRGKTKRQETLKRIRHRVNENKMVA